MMRFKQFISEGKYPMWVRLTVSGLVLNTRNLSKAIENEQDPMKQNKKRGCKLNLHPLFNLIIETNILLNQSYHH